METARQPARSEKPDEDGGVLIVNQENRADDVGEAEHARDAGCTTRVAAVATGRLPHVTIILQGTAGSPGFASVSTAARARPTK